MSAEEEGTEPYQPVISQTSGIDWARARYDVKLWLLIMLYIPFSTAAILIITGNVLVLCLEAVFVAVAMSFIFNTLQEKKRQASKGNYIDGRTNFPNREIIEQLKVEDIITEAKPADPYPFHAAMVQENEWLGLLTSLGDDYITYEAGAAKKEMEKQIEKAVEARIVAEVLTCNNCGEVFNNMNKYNNHRKKCKKELRMLCPTCSMVFTDVKKYNKHISKCKPKIYVCAICNQVANNEKDYYKHMESHAEKPESKDREIVWGNPI